MTRTNMTRRERARHRARLAKKPERRKAREAHREAIRVARLLADKPQEKHLPVPPQTYVLHSMATFNASVLVTERTPAIPYPPEQRY